MCLVRSVFELGQVRCGVNGVPRNAVLILIVLSADGLSGWIDVLDELVAVSVLLDHLLVVVGLHEVGNARCAGSRVQHLLAVLAVLSHHLMVLLFLLLQLVVESLELSTLVVRSREDGVDVLAERDLR